MNEAKNAERARLRNRKKANEKTMRSHQMDRIDEMEWNGVERDESVCILDASMNDVDMCKKDECDRTLMGTV